MTSVVKQLDPLVLEIGTIEEVFKDMSALAASTLRTVDVSFSLVVVSVPNGVQMEEVDFLLRVRTVPSKRLSPL